MKSLKSLKTAIALAAFAAAFGAHAATDTAQLEIRGSVATNCTIAVTPTAKATTLDILGGESDTLVGVVTENCNNGNGYTVSLTSNNAGQLLSKATGAKPYSYAARYDDGVGDIAKQIVAGRDKAFFGRSGNLSVSFSGDKQAIAGVYSDIINLVIAGK